MAVLDVDFTLTETAIVALQVAFPVASPGSVSWTLSGDASDSGSFSTTTANIENAGAATELGNSIIIGELSPGDYNLEADGTITAIRAAVGQPGTGYVPQQLGGGAHSEPRSLYTDGATISSHLTVSAREVHCSVDGVYIGELMGDLSAIYIDEPDLYHRTACFARTATGLLCVCTSHNKRLAYKWVPWDTDLATTAANLCAASVVTISTSVGGSCTYNRLAVSTDGSEVFILFRGWGKAGAMIRMAGFGTGITVQADYLFDDGAAGNGWAYPRLCKIEQDGDGNDKLLVGYSVRPSGSGWAQIIGAIYDPAGNQWYNSAGDTIGGTSYGTSSVPRWTTEVSTPVASGGIELVDAPGSGSRYCSFLTGRLTDWTSAGTKEAEFIAAYMDGDDSDGYTAETIESHLAIIRGDASDATTTSLSTLSDLDSSITYRIGGMGYYDSGTCHCLLIQGATENIDVANDYANWGAEGNGSDQATCKHFTVDVSGGLPDLDTDLTDAGDITVACPSGERFIDVGEVRGVDNRALFHVGVGRVNDWDPHGTMISYDVVESSPGGSSSRRGGFGGFSGFRKQT